MNITSHRAGPIVSVSIGHIPHLVIDLSNVVAIQSWKRDELPAYVIEVYGAHGALFLSEYERECTWAIVLRELTNAFKDWKFNVSGYGSI